MISALSTFHSGFIMRSTLDISKVKCWPTYLSFSICLPGDGCCRGILTRCWRRCRGPSFCPGCGGEGSWHRDLMHKEKQKSHCQGFPLLYSSTGDPSLSVCSLCGLLLCRCLVFFVLQLTLDDGWHYVLKGISIRGFRGKLKGLQQVKLLNHTQNAGIENVPL